MEALFELVSPAGQCRNPVRCFRNRCSLQDELVLAAMQMLPVLGTGVFAGAEAYRERYG